MRGVIHAGRRRWQRPAKRRRRLLIAGAGLAVFFFVVFALPFFTSSSSPDTAYEEHKPDQGGKDLSPNTLKSATSTGPPTATTVFPTPPAPSLPVAQRQTQNPAATAPPTTQSEGAVDGHPILRSDGLYRAYAQELAALEALDVFTLRPGEARVSFAQFATCLGELLAVDPVVRTETPRPKPINMEVAPLLISVTAGNTQDLKAMICNLTMPYKYIVLGQTGDTPEMTPFFDLLNRVFDFTKRLIVLQFKESAGSAAATNAGLREALRHPFAEVPFVHIIHNDVRYLGTALQDLVQEAYLTISPDEEMIQYLEAEVKTEPNAFTPLIRRPRGLRAPMLLDGPLPQQTPDKESVLVTSALLPDRVRYMAAAERRRQMEGRVSFFFHNSRGEYTAVFLSRLAVLTAGFFDENFYPVMFDDTDLRWRASMLGFEERYFEQLGGSLITFDVDCTNVEVDGDETAPKVGKGPLLPLTGVRGTAATGGKPLLSPETRTLLKECRAAFNRGAQFQYMERKWGVDSFLELAAPTPQREPFASEAFSGKKHLPLDAWVVSKRRIADVKRALRDTGMGGMQIEPYDPEVIFDALL